MNPEIWDSNLLIKSASASVSAATSVIVVRIAVVIASATERIRHYVCRCRAWTKLCYEIRCLCLLRSGELVSLYLVAKVLNFSLRLTFLECAELVTNVLLERIDFALQLTSLVSEGIVCLRESAFHTCIYGVDCTLKRVRLLTD